MSFGTKPRQPGKRGGDGPPSWFVFILGVALMFGLYYLWQGVRDFLRTGGGGVVEATERAVVIASATAVRQVRPTTTATPGPSPTPIPDCQDFVVTVSSARVREAPNTEAPTITSFSEGEPVCVLGRDPDSEWYTVDVDSSPFRRQLAYMHESVISAVNPTPRPTRTTTALPTVTPLPTFTPWITLSPNPTAALGESLPTPTPPPAPTDTIEPTMPLQSA